MTTIMQHLRPPFRTQRSPCALALALLSLAVSCWSADLAWPAASDGAGLPAGWELERSTASMGKAEFSHGTLRLTCETVRACHLTRALGIDGTDQAPLRLECRIGVEHPEGLDGLPTYIALYWGPSSAICIGLGGIEQWRERWMPARRRAWSYWLNGPEHGFSRSESAFYSGAVRGHFRLLCTSHDVSAYASVDGLRWQLLSSFERKAGQFSGPPERVIIGRGWYGEQANQQLPHLLNDLGDPAQSQTLTWSVSDLSITTELPKAMLSQAYRKPKGFDEAHEAWLTPAPLRDWQVIGPMPWSDKPYPPEQAVDLKAHLPLADGHDGVWLPYPADEHNGAILSLKGVLKLTAENQLSYATAVVNADADRLERFWFDGQRGVMVFVNGVAIGNAWHDEEPVADRPCTAGRTASWSRWRRAAATCARSSACATSRPTPSAGSPCSSAWPPISPTMPRMASPPSTRPRICGRGWACSTRPPPSSTASPTATASRPSRSTAPSSSVRACTACCATSARWPTTSMAWPSGAWPPTPIPPKRPSPA
jgi:hypothetical protein